MTDPQLSASQLAEVFQLWKQPHRGWHALPHLEELLRATECADATDSDREFLRYLALFHDAVYEPLSKTNEEDSAELAARFLPNYSRLEELKRAILSTKAHTGQTDLEKLFNQWDCAILKSSDSQRLDQYESGIAFEFVPCVGLGVYRHERIKFLTWAAVAFENPALAELAMRV